MSCLLQLLLGREHILGGSDTLAPLAEPGSVDAEVADLVLHRRRRPLRERGPLPLRRARELAETAGPVALPGDARPRHVPPHVGEHGLLDRLDAKPCGPLADAAGVTPLAPVDPVAVLVGGALQTVPAARAAQQAGEQVRARVDTTSDAARLRHLPGREIDDRLVRGRVDEPAVLAVGELAEVDTVAQEPVHRFFAPHLRPLRRRDTGRLEHGAKLGGPGAAAACDEDVADDGRGDGVDLEAAVGAFAVADGGTVVDGDAALDRLLLRPLEADAGALADVGGELEQDPGLEASLGCRPVGGRVGRVDASAGVGDPPDERVRVLAVAGEPVEPRDDDAGGLAVLDAAQRFLQAGTLPLAAGLVEVGDDQADVEVLCAGECAAAPLLLVGADQVFAAPDTADTDVKVDGGHGGPESSRSSAASHVAAQHPFSAPFLTYRAAIWAWKLWARLEGRPT